MVDQTGIGPPPPGAGGVTSDLPFVPAADFSLLGGSSTTDPGPGMGIRVPSAQAPSPGSPWPDLLLPLSGGGDLGRLYLECALEWVQSQSLQVSRRGRGDSTEAFVDGVVASLSTDERERLKRVGALADRYHRVLEFLG